MIPRHKIGNYHEGCNQTLLDAVPAEALRILEVGCGAGKLGGLLKQANPRRYVCGIECEATAAAEARQRLDEVFEIDLEKGDAPIEPGSLDCILYGDVLEHLVDPETVLRKHRRLLAPTGCILCSVPNIQHHSIVTDLLRGNFQYADSGLLDATHMRFFTYSTFTKMLLDTGFAPEIVGVNPGECSPALSKAARPLMKFLGLDPAKTAQYLSAYQYIFRGRPVSYLGAEADAPAEPLTFVVCVSNKAVLQANLLSSPCLAPGTPHEVIVMKKCRTAAEGLNQGIAQARNSVVVCVHQDVYLPVGWPERFWQQWRQAEQTFGAIGVAGAYGVAGAGAARTQTGRVVDRDRLLDEQCPLPATVDTLDELVIAVRKDNNLSFDTRLGFHFYGADIALAAAEQGLQAVVLDALCYHNSATVDLGSDFKAAGRVFARKWAKRLPVGTSCANIDQRWLKAPRLAKRLFQWLTPSKRN